MPWKERLVLLLILCAFATAVAFSVVRHGVWLDEAHAWCVARDSAHIGDLSGNLRNEGHPWGWILLLWIFSHAGLGCWSMQVLQVLFAVATAGFVLFRAPLPMWWRVLIICGYFFLFEYAVPARNYAVGVLLLLLAIEAHRKRPWGGWAVLWWMLLPHVHFWCIAFTLTFLLHGFITDRTWGRQRTLLTVLVGSSALLALYTAWPADHLAYAPTLEQEPRAMWERALTVAAEALWPWCDATAANPWGTQWLAAQGAVGRWVAAGLLVLVGVVLPGWKERLLYAGFVVATLILPFCAPFASVRYGGPWIVGLVAVLWTYPHALPGRFAAWVLVPLFALQALCGMHMVMLHAQRGFSKARDTVQWLEANGYGGLPVAVQHYAAGPAISAYTDAPVFYPGRGSFGSFAVWHPFVADAAPQQLDSALGPLEAERFILLARSADVAGYLRRDGVTVEVLTAFQGGMITAEDNVVLLVQR